ncbi:hypothetical protein QBC40DRAFT_194280 [Triangularia verruculosa]|uniref:Uncharacterized protein n=1 Tax=Triangularia verruculosa TaxID=2587418 RepID=A0AAN6XQC2_9PEZI|nr:hypothetical protein QBC40DRAFT_194280 [Triangularia verruculosa]
MDNHAFENCLANFKTITESTSYLEIFSYSDSSFNYVSEGGLSPEQFDNFLQQINFSPVALPQNVHLLAGMRLILQVPATNPETFAPSYMSMSHDNYRAMIKALHLPRMAIETSTAVGLYFWYALDIEDDGTPYLHMVFRKSDVRKKGHTRGWELILSHNLKTSMTTGFAKGTGSSNLSDTIQHLKACTAELGHAMLLPLVQLHHTSSAAADLKQRDARDWLRLIEHAISIDRVDDPEGHQTSDGNLDLDIMRHDLMECQAQTLWNRPALYLVVIDSMEEAAQLFMKMLPDERKCATVEKFQGTVISRLMLHRKRWNGIEVYSNTTRQRIEIQRSVLYNIMSIRESKLNLQMAGEQKRLAQSSEREATAMKGIALLGAVFLPGTFLASIFSTTFFDFRDAASVVSSNFWLYWVSTIPFTALVVALYFEWQKRRERKYAKQDADERRRDLEDTLEKKEARILAASRRRNETLESYQRLRFESPQNKPEVFTT